ncbi:MAG: hypothetical protein V3S14_12355 [Anaerolineae bacterium]
MTGSARERARRWGILLGMTFVVALGVALLVLMLYRPAQQPLEMGGGAAPVGLHVSLAESVTAQSVYPSAMDVAQSWQPDGQLAIVSARWRPRRGRWPSDVTWMFQFYSPTVRRLAVIVVNGGRARLLQETAVPYSLSTFSEDDWQVDSLAALDTWWNAGGATFMSVYSEIDLVAQLRVLEGKDDRLAWTITGIAGGQMRNLIVDGTTGERVQD